MRRENEVLGLVRRDKDIAGWRSNTWWLVLMPF